MAGDDRRAMIDERSVARETGASTAQSKFKHESAQRLLLIIYCLLLIEASTHLTRDISRC